MKEETNPGRITSYDALVAAAARYKVRSVEGYDRAARSDSRLPAQPDLEFPVAWELHQGWPGFLKKVEASTGSVRVPPRKPPLIPTTSKVAKPDERTLRVRASRHALRD